MAIKIATAYEVKNNFPEYIHIDGEQDTNTNKWRARVFLKKGKEVFKLILITPFEFDHKQTAENHARTVCESIVNDKNL